MTQTGARLRTIHLYPLKSAAGLSVGSARVEARGLAGDRRMMVVDADGAALTARVAPKLLTITVQIDAQDIVLTAPGRRPLTVALQSLSAMPGGATVWGDPVASLDGGEAAADWLAALLGRPARLAIEHAATQRTAGLPQGGEVSFADTAPLLLVNTASLAAVNAQLDAPVEMARFRANLVVDGCAAFEEDEWETVRIGAVEFTVAAPCDRCVMITLDPHSGQPDPQGEPLSLLVRHRRGPDGKVYFGQFLMPRTTGRVHAGDPVEVLRRKPRPVLSGPPLTAPAVAATSNPSADDRAPLTLTCIGRIVETPDMMTFCFATSRQVSYRPGQYIALLPEIDGQQVRRTYTISSSPSRPAHLAVTVKRVAGGLVSNYLHDHLQIGDRMAGQGGLGKFHLDAVPQDKPLLMISAGSGITPMIAMLRYIADHALALDVRFHHSARGLSDLPFMAELSALQHQVAGPLAISWNLTGEQGRDGNMHGGRLDAAMLAAIAPDLETRSVLCCGPDGFRALVRDLHDTWPAPDKGVYAEESFGGNRSRADTLPPIGRYDVSFVTSGRSTSGEGARSLLELARAQGIAMTSSCEAGICGTCRCRVRTGEWQLAANCADIDRNALSADEKAAGYVLACTTNPVGHVEVEL